MNLDRRRVLFGLLAAPIVLRAGLIMPVHSGLIVPAMVVSWYERFPDGMCVRHEKKYYDPTHNYIAMSPTQPGNLISEVLIACDPKQHIMDNRFYVGGQSVPPYRFTGLIGANPNGVMLWK